MLKNVLYWEKKLAVISEDLELLMQDSVNVVHNWELILFVKDLDVGLRELKLDVKHGPRMLVSVNRGFKTSNGS